MEMEEPTYDAPMEDITSTITFTTTATTSTTSTTTSHNDKITALLKRSEQSLEALRDIGKFYKEFNENWESERAEGLELLASIRDTRAKWEETGVLIQELHHRSRRLAERVQSLGPDKLAMIKQHKKDLLAQLNKAGDYTKYITSTPRLGLMTSSTITTTRICQ